MIAANFALDEGFKIHPRSLYNYSRHQEPTDSYVVNEVYYKGTLLDYVFESRYRCGPNGEHYIVATDRLGLDDLRLPHAVSDTEWKWLPDLDSGIKYLFEREFISHL